MVNPVVLLDVEDELFKECFGHDSQWPCQLLSLTSEENSTDEISKVLKSSSCVVIQNIGGPSWNAIIDYYKSGGLVVYFGIVGEFSAPQDLSQAFGLNWHFSAYTRHDYVLTEAGKAILGDAITEQEYSKANLLSVPEEDRLLVPKNYYETLDDYIKEEGDSDNERESMQKKYDELTEQLGNEVPLALHKADHGGQMAYLGFVNGDGNISKFVRALCTRSKTAA